MELKNETRESFIFHAEYIADIPEELQPQYAMHAINYALKGIEPELTDWRDVKMWNAIKSRIDQERELYEKKCSNLKQKQKKTSGTDKAPSDTENKVSDTDKTTSDTENEIPAGDIEFESDLEFENETERENESEAPKVPVRESPPMQEYAKKIFNIFQAAGLPCARGNFISFLQRDFKNGLGHLQRHYHSNDVIGACENYAKTVNDPESYITGKYSFDRFVTFKNFVDYLPGNYNPDNFKDSRKQIAQEAPKKKSWQMECPRCKANALEWDNDTQMYKCGSCGKSYTYEQIAGGK